jgi:hypothetical protein
VRLIERDLSRRLPLQVCRTLLVLSALLAIAALLIPGLAAVEESGASQPRRGTVCGNAPAQGGRLYSNRSPLNQPIAAGAQVDPASDEMVQGILDATRQRPLVVAVRWFSVPVFVAGKSTARHNVSLTAPWATEKTLKAVPIPATARPDPSSDGYMAIIDRSTGCEYDYWQASRRPDGSWSASWAGKISTAGSGIFRRHGGRASGFSLLAGLIFPVPLREGRIDHALVLSYPYTRAGPPVPPATSSDGRSTGPNTIPEGARIRLDPSLDLSQLQLRPYELTIARALQTYGAFVGDTGGAVSLFAAHPFGYSRNPYAQLLPSLDYVPLDHIPLDRLQVLKLPTP